MSKKPKPAAPAAPVIEVPQGTKPNKLKVKDIDIEVIHVRDKRDRTRDGAFRAGIRELAASMAAIGLRQPITLRAVPTDGEHCFDLVAGERRLEAAKLLGWTSIPAEVLDADAEAIDQDIRAAENLQREDLNEDQKALAIGDLVAAAEEVQARQQGVEGAAKIAALPAPARDAIRKAAVAAVAQRFGKPPQWVRDYAYVGDLPRRVRELAAARRLSLAHCKVLAAVVDPELCTEIAEQAAADGEPPICAPMMELTELRRIVNAHLSSLAKVPWYLTVRFAGKQDCHGCPDNSRNRTGLFDGRGKEHGARGDRGVTTDIDFTKDAEDCGVCLNAACYRAKADACKTAIRNAGNKLAGKAVEAKPKERGSVVAAGINDANQRSPFVKPTVFRQAVQERVDAKLEKPKGTAGKGMQRKSTEQSAAEEAKRQATWKFNDAMRDRNEKLVGQFAAWAMKRDAADRALLMLAFESEPARQVVLDGKKGAAAIPAFKALLKLATDAGSITAFDAIVGKVPADIVEHLVDWRMRDRVEVVDFLAGIAGVKDLPPVPKLEDFLPKPEPKAAQKSKTSAPAKNKPAAKPAAKKKAKKSKMSPGDDAPVPMRKETWDSVMESKDDRGRSERQQPAHAGEEA